MRARLLYPFCLALLIVCAFGVFGASAGGAAEARPSAARCIATGPRFVIYPVHGGAARRGNTYLVHSMTADFRPLSCPYVKRALARIFRANPVPWRPASAALPRGARLRGAPAGYVCTGSSTNPSGKDVNDIVGQCQSNKALFDWAPYAPKSA